MACRRSAVRSRLAPPPSTAKQNIAKPSCIAPQVEAARVPLPYLVAVPVVVLKSHTGAAGEMGHANGKYARCAAWRDRSAGGAVIDLYRQPACHGSRGRRAAHGAAAACANPIGGPGRSERSGGKAAPQRIKADHADQSRSRFRRPARAVADAAANAGGGVAADECSGQTDAAGGPRLDRRRARRGGRLPRPAVQKPAPQSPPRTRSRAAACSPRIRVICAWR